jgi:hypothetical protein
MKRFVWVNRTNVAWNETLHRSHTACPHRRARLVSVLMREGSIIRAPLLRLAMGLPLALLASIALLIYLLVQSRRPVA